MMIHTHIGEFKFENCIMNASGVHCQTALELDELNQSKAGTFVTKSATLEPREGNSSPRVWSIPSGTINSMGLPNLGIDYYLAYLEKTKRDYPEKNYILSVTGLSEEDIHQLLEKVQASSFTGLTELNLSCPNVVGKPQIGYDFDAIDRILKQVFVYFEQPLGVKLPPYFDLVHFDQVADILNQYPLTFINTVNSIGNGLAIEDETVTIKPKNGFGGVGGLYIKPTALANVHAFYQRVHPSITIIGTGGVKTGRDIFEHILCGASMVQVGSALFHEGPNIFERLTKELEVIMDEKGYTSIEDFKGTLKYID